MRLRLFTAEQASALTPYLEVKTQRIRALKGEWDAVRAVLTRYDAAQQAELAVLMQAYLGPTLSPWRQDFTALVGQAGEQAAGIYEADYRDFNRDTYARGRATFDASYAAFKRLMLAAWRRDELAAREKVPA